MIRQEMLESTIQMVTEYENSSDILRTNYNYICEKIKNNNYGKHTLEELEEIKKMYAKALRKCYRNNSKKRKELRLKGAMI